MSSAGNYSKPIRLVLLGAAILCLTAGVVVGWVSTRGHLSVLAWGSGVWIATQGILTVGDITFDDEGMKRAWEAVTKPVAGLVGISVFGYAAGAAGNRNNATLLVGILVLLVALYVSAKVVQRGRAPSTTSEGGQ